MDKRSPISLDDRMNETTDAELHVALSWLAEVASDYDHSALDAIGLPEVIREAIASNERDSKRRRNLPANVVMWIAIAMSIYRGVSLRQLVQLLGIRGDGGGPVASSSITEARGRLGVAPIRHVFEELAMRWGHDSADADRWHGYSLYAFDGTTMAVEDTEDNEQHFGRPGSSRGRAGYPKLRLVVLMAIHSRLLVDASFGPCRGKGTGETSLASSMWDGIPDRSILLFDKGFFDTGRMARFVADGTDRHFLSRARADLNYSVVRTIDKHDSLIDIHLSEEARKAHPDLPTTIRARRIEYQIGNHKPSVLITSLVEDTRHSAADLVALYHERWEIELTYRNIKTTQLQRLESLRSRTAAGVEQELWGVLIAYQLVRYRMFLVAQDLDVAPRRLSFKTALIAVHAFGLQMTIPLRDPALVRYSLDWLNTAIADGLMPERRLRASYPRHVKVKMSNYKRNPGRGRPPTPRKQSKKP